MILAMYFQETVVAFIALIFLYQFGCQSLEASDVQVNLYAKYSFKLSNYDIEMHEEIHQTSEIFVQSTRIVLEKEKCLSLSIGVKKIFTI